MNITKEIKIIDLALFIKKSKSLIISDLHLGYEDALKKQGVLIPKLQYKEIINRLNYIFSKLSKINEVVFNGDLKHEFGSINRQEWKETLNILDFIRSKGAKIIVIKGNHDTILNPILKKKNIKEIKELRINNILIAHGDYIPKKLEKFIIIGHEHPAVTLRDSAKYEKFKCFLKGKFKNSVLIVQPSFNNITEGKDVLKEKTLSPFLKDIENFECFIVNDNTHEILNFGKIKNIKKI